MSIVEFGRRFMKKEIKARSCRLMQPITGESRDDNGPRLVRAVDRKGGYRLGTLDEARAAFVRLIGVPIDWETADEVPEEDPKVVSLNPRSRRWEG